MQRLKQGYKAYQEAIHQNSEKFLYPASKQQEPHSMIISCCDSRVNPCQIFQAHAGEIFLYQNIAGHLPPPDSDSSIQTTAALRFGIDNLHITHLIFLAHTDCAGLKAATQNYRTLDPDLKKWLKKLKSLPAHNEIQLLQTHLRQNVQNALSHAFVAEKVKKKRLFIHSMVYQVESGILLIDQDNQLIAF